MANDVYELSGALQQLSALLQMIALQHVKAKGPRLSSDTLHLPVLFRHSHEVIWLDFAYVCAIYTGPLSFKVISGNAF